jgi:hypothetical protein
MPGLPIYSLRRDVLLAPSRLVDGDPVPPKVVDGLELVEAAMRARRIL